MAFMTPIIKPGWNLYNCHPPPGRIRYIKRANSKQTTASSSSSSSNKATASLPQNGKINANLLQRRSSLPLSVGRNAGDKAACSKNPNPRLVAPLKAIHIKPTLQGHYYLTSFSTDSLQFRNLDVAMQAIPEESDEVDHDGESTSDSSEAPCMISSNPELELPSSQLLPPHRERRAQRLLLRFRQMFHLSPSTAAKPRSDSSRKENTLTEGQVKSLPSFFKNLHRRRS